MPRFSAGFTLRAQAAPKSGFASSRGRFPFIEKSRKAATPANASPIKASAIDRAISIARARKGKTRAAISASAAARASAAEASQWPVAAPAAGGAQKQRDHDGAVHELVERRGAGRQTRSYEGDRGGHGVANGVQEAEDGKARA